MIAFSPRIHHAIGFAAKYHEGQRRKARNTPYIVHPFEVALILARYGRPEADLMAALLHDVPEDCASTVAETEQMFAKIRDKFGAEVATIVWHVTETKRDQANVKLDVEIRRKLYLENLGNAPEGSWWVCAADKIHNGSTLMIDLMHAQDRDAVWNTFSGGKEAVRRWYRSVHTRLTELDFQGEIMAELGHVASMLESAAITHSDLLPRPTGLVSRVIDDYQLTQANERT